MKTQIGYSMKYPFRNRYYYTFLVCLTILLGLFSRTTYIPAIIYPYLGDSLYAVLIYLIAATVFYKKPSSTIFYIATAVCFAIEISQLYQGETINDIRNSRIGSLILGHGFLWSDLFAYLVGTGASWLTEYGYKTRKALP